MSSRTRPCLPSLPCLSAALAAASVLSACDAPHAAAIDAAAPVSTVSSATVATLAIPAIDASAPPPASATIAAVQRAAGSILVGGESMTMLRALTEAGPRLTGSEQLTHAAGWAVDTFHTAGVAQAAIEPFSIPASWSRRATVAHVTAPEERAIASIAIGWMPPTPADGIRGDLVLVTDLSLASQKAMGPALRGKIAIFTRDAAKPLDKKIDRAVAIGALRSHGVTGIVLIGGRDNDVVGANSLAGLDLVGPVPAISIGKEDGAWITQRLEKGPVTLAFTNESPMGSAVDVPNVVAEIRGRERPDEWLLVGAHLDSWDLATGAQDNGSGAVEVIEAARAIAATGRPPLRSIRFALWGGEEEGLLGSMAYEAAHAKELDRLVFVLNTDHGAGAPKGWILDGREDLVPAFKAFGAPFLGGLGALGVATEMDCNTDHCAFMLAGVPTANLDVDMTHYMEIHHTLGDTIEKIDAGSLARSAAIVATTAYALADAPERLASRLGHAAVAKNLKKLGLADELASGGYWKP